MSGDTLEQPVTSLVYVVAIRVRKAVGACRSVQIHLILANVLWCSIAAIMFCCSKIIKLEIKSTC